MLLSCHPKHLDLLSKRRPFTRFLPTPTPWIYRHSKQGSRYGQVKLKGLPQTEVMYKNESITYSCRLGVVRLASQSNEDSEPGFQQELLSATRLVSYVCAALHAIASMASSASLYLIVRRVQALEAYRQLVQQSPSDIDLFQAALLIAKHRHPLLVYVWQFQCMQLLHCSTTPACCCKCSCFGSHACYYMSCMILFMLCNL